MTVGERANLWEQKFFDTTSSMHVTKRVFVLAVLLRLSVLAARAPRTKRG